MQNAAHRGHAAIPREANIIFLALQKRNIIMTSPLIHTYGQMKTLTPLCTVSLNSVSVSLCGVQFWMISWLLPSPSKVVLEERFTLDFYRRK
jgi:hypothetical protein